MENNVAEVKLPQKFLLSFAYVIWCVGISAYFLSSFVKLIQEFLAVNYGFISEAVMVLAQVGFQWLFMTRACWQERVRYMFIALSVSMIGSLMLLPLMVYNSFYFVSAAGAASYFFCVVGIIFLFHHRLILKNSLPGILSFTWVIYRVILLLFLTVPR